MPPIQMLGRGLVDDDDAEVVAVAVVPYHWVANTIPMYCYYLVGLVQRERIGPMIGLFHRTLMHDVVVATFEIDVVAGEECVKIDIEPWCIHNFAVVVVVVVVVVVGVH